MNYLFSFETLIIFMATYVIWIELAYGLYIYYKADKSDKKLLHILGLIVPIIYIIGLIVSTIYYNPRPFVVGNFEPLVYHHMDNGFPSDHSLIAFGVAFMFLLYKRNVGIACLIMASMVGLGRILAGVHHPIDVGMSIIIAFIVYAITHVIMKKLTRGEL